MKFTNFFLMTVIAFFAFSFTVALVEYKVDKNRSKIHWVGKKVTGQHEGNITVSEGKFICDGKTVTGGSFVIDMNSMTCTDISDAEYNKQLIGHLKNDDFFSTTKHPQAKFVISSLTSKGKDQFDVKGKLTIKDITNDISFPATIQVVKDEIKAKAKITVDRTKFNIKYASGSFFDNLGDKSIDDSFDLEVDLVAKK